MWTALHSRTPMANRARVLDVLFYSLLIFFAFLSQTFWFTQHPKWMAIGMIGDLFLTMPVIVSFVFWNSKKLTSSLSILFLLEGFFAVTLFNPYWDLLHGTPGWLKIGLWIVPSIGNAVFLCWTLKKVLHQCRNLTKNMPKDLPVDRMDIIQSSCQDFFGSGFLSKVIATELTMFSYAAGERLAAKWFGFPASTLPTDSVYTYHQKSGIGVLLSCFAMVLIMEITGVHFLVSQYSHLAAWTLTLPSLYLGIQLFGHYRSLSLRPIVFDGEKLHFRNGLMMQCMVDLNQIELIEKTQKTPSEKKYHLLSLPAGHNVVVTLKTVHRCRVLYGGEAEFQNLLIFLDDPDTFLEKFSIQHDSNS